MFQFTLLFFELWCSFCLTFSMIFLNFALNEKLMSSTAQTEIVKTCFILLSVLSDDGRLRQGIFTMSIFDLYTQASGKYS